MIINNIHCVNDTFAIGHNNMGLMKLIIGRNYDIKILDKKLNIYHLNLDAEFVEYLLSIGYTFKSDIYYVFFLIRGDFLKKGEAIKYDVLRLLAGKVIF